jgi:murein DD-endopeptidase MepM/ murein hydrolase activator NlpD
LINLDKVTMLVNCSILKQANHKPLSRLRFTGLTVSAAALMMFGIVTAFGTAPNTITYAGHYENIVESISAQKLSHIEDTPTTRAIGREVRVQQGDTIASILSRLNAQDDELLAHIRASKNADSLFRQLAPGKTITAQILPDGDVQSLTFPLNGGKDAALQIRRTPNGLEDSVQHLQLETRISMQTAVVRYSLFGAADDAGIPDSVAVQLADIFGGDIDFHRDLRKGDRFSVIYETTAYQGKTIRAERILAAEFWNDGRPYQAFWYQPQPGYSGGYYSAMGKSLKKAFLRSPLEFSRITSGFSTARYHPVLNEIRAHKGIDYGAPVGTRVKATGSGVVEFAGNQGGYGKVVVLHHSGDKQTVYGHLSGFAPGIKKGTRVEQGDVIAFVGATGLATGPHLHYEFRIAGTHRNPLTVALPEAPPIPDFAREAFTKQVRDLNERMVVIRDSQLVMLD